MKANPSEYPIFFVALNSDTVPLYTVNEYAETLIAQRISTISGVSRVQVFGAQKYASADSGRPRCACRTSGRNR